MPQHDEEPSPEDDRGGEAPRPPAVGLLSTVILVLVLVILVLLYFLLGR